MTTDSTTASTRTSPDADPHPAGVGVGGPLVLLVGAVAASASVSRYDGRIVAVYSVLTVALLATTAGAVRGVGPRAARERPGWLRRACAVPTGTRSGAAVVLTACGAGTWVAPTFTYLAQGPATLVRLVLSGAAWLGAALVVIGPRRWHAAPLAVAVMGHVAAAALLVHHDPAPRIDVWVMLQQAADATAEGRNMYTTAWTGSPGVQDAFTYLPGMGLLVAPGRWLAGDVRWALLPLTVLAATLPWVAVRRRARTTAKGVERPDARAAAVLGSLVLLLPGTATQVEQAWTEPVLLAGIVAWYLATVAGRRRVGVAALGVALACKQHVWPLLLVIGAWRRFGVRRVVASVAVAAVIMAPWAVADPAAMWHDTVTLLVRFRALLFADTLYIAAIQELGWTPPFALTAAVLALTLGLAAFAVRRWSPPPAVVLRVLAATLLVANLVNKQAFYNQYWLVMTLVLVSWIPTPAVTARLCDPLTPAEPRPESAGV